MLEFSPAEVCAYSATPGDCYIFTYADSISSVHTFIFEGKKSLVDASYRVKMCQKAVKDSNWVDVSEWEVEQEGWTRTAKVLASYNKIINESGRFDSPVRCILLCGADLLESVLVPGLWQQSDLEYIFSECKIAVHKREGLDLEALIRENPFLYKHRDNILIIPQTIHNNISSTNIRNALKLGLSVKYLMPKAVTDYIYKHGLYGSITPP